MSKKIVVAICGASGALYGIRLLKALLAQPVQISLIISRAGRMVLAHETGYPGGVYQAVLAEADTARHPRADLVEYDPDNLFAPPASGSARHDGMVIAPCSMKTLGAIAAGLSDSLIQRAADVALKEKHPLILLPRETPLSTIHLHNMLRAAEAGATILPAAPSFYTHPQSVDDLVDTVIARVLDHLKIEHHLVRPWGAVEGGEGGSV